MPDMTTRPVIMGTRGVVTSGHYLATAAGFRMMEQGGNAIDAAAAMVHSVHFPSSFYPPIGYPGPVIAESRIPAGVSNELGQKGHEVVSTGAWSNGKTMGIRYDKDHGVIMGAVAPKGNIGYAIGW